MVRENSSLRAHLDNYINEKNKTICKLWIILKNSIFLIDFNKIKAENIYSSLMFLYMSSM